MQRTMTALALTMTFSLMALPAFALGEPDAGALDYSRLENTPGESLEPPAIDWSGLTGEFEPDQLFGGLSQVTVPYGDEQTVVTREHVQALVTALDAAVTAGKPLTGSVTIDGKVRPLVDELKRQTAWWKKAMAFVPMTTGGAAPTVDANAFVADGSMGVDSPTFQELFAAVVDSPTVPAENAEGTPYSLVKAVAATYEAIGDNAFKYNVALSWTNGADGEAAYGAPDDVRAAVETGKLNTQKLHQLFLKG